MQATMQNLSQVKLSEHLATSNQLIARSFSYSEDGKQLFFLQGTANLIQASAELDHFKSIPLAETTLGDLLVNPTGEVMFTNQRQSPTITAWAIPTGKVINEFKGLQGRTYAPQLSNDYLVASSLGQHILIWQASSGELLYDLLHQDLVFGYQLNHSGSQLISWGLKGALAWQLSDGQSQARPLPNNGPRISQVLFSSDDQNLFCLSQIDDPVMPALQNKVYLERWHAFGLQLQQRFLVASDSGFPHRLHLWQDSVVLINDRQSLRAMQTSDGQVLGQWQSTVDQLDYYYLAIHPTTGQLIHADADQLILYRQQLLLKLEATFIPTILSS